MNALFRSPPVVLSSQSVLVAGSSRTLTRLAIPSGETSLKRIADWVTSIPDDELEQRMKQLRAHFGSRCDSMERSWQSNFLQANLPVRTATTLSDSRQLYAGSLVSKEFAFESLALSNPGLCAHADQSGLADGDLRLLLAMDAAGQDPTVSGIVLREFIVDRDHRVCLGAEGDKPYAPEPVPNPVFQRGLIFRQLCEMGFDNKWTRSLMQSLGDEFTRGELKAAIGTASGPTRENSPDRRGSLECLRWLAEVNYAVTFDPSSLLSDRVIFSPLPLGGGGSRLHHGCFTLVTSAKGSVYLGSCTGSNGSRELPQILKSTDLFHFKVTLVGGGASRFGGMALFPEKFEGRFAAVCHRADDSIYLMYSENEAMWEIAELLRGPQEAWELRGLQVCGAPLRTRAGWLVLYGASSEMDHRAIGAMLVDANDPSKVLGHLKEPLIAERHVTGRAVTPGVLQSSGSIVHNGRLFICYTLDQKEVLVDQFNLDAVLGAIRGR